MRRLVLLLAVAVSVVGWSGVAQATEYHVGSGQQYGTMNALLAAVTLGDNDIAWVHAGTYGSFTVSSGGGSSQANAAQIRAYDINNKPVFSGGTNSIQIGSLGKWYKLYGIVQTSATTRGIFHTCGGLIIQNCKVQNTPDGIMSGMCNTRSANPGYLVAEYNELTGNGSGTQYHSWYLQEYWCQIRYNWTHNAAGGIGYKDRSRTSTVEYNLIEPGSSGAGCAVSFCGWDDSEMPDVSATATMTGNIITKNGGGNSWLFINNIRAADGGTAGHTQPGYLYLYNNTFYTVSHTGPMLADDERSIIAAHNNIFHTTSCTYLYGQVDGANGPGQVLTSYNNWVKSTISRPAAFTSTVTGTAPGVVNAATSGGDWHLTSGSQCINAGRNGLSVVPNKEYAHPMNYTTRTSDGSIDIGAYEYVGAGSPPVANFTGNPTSGSTPLTVAFTDTSTNTPTSWSWTFGDGGTSTARNPSHQYTSAGSFTVSLTATNAYGSDGETKTNYITASTPPSPPVANFTGSPTSGAAPLAVSFTDTSTNSPTAWSWTFGDGGTATVRNPSHTYNSAGSYTVSLTATNAGGSDGETKSNYITATGAGVAYYPMTSYSVLCGTLVSGTLASTQSSDNSYLQLRAPSPDYRTGGRFIAATGVPPSQVTKITAQIEYRNSRSDTNGKMDLSFWRAPDWTTYDDVWNASAFTTTDTWMPEWSTTAVSTYMDSSGNIHLDFGGGCSLTTQSTWDLYLDTVRVKLDLAPAPVANFTGTPTNGAAPLAVAFSDTSTNSPTAWSWTFGDGGTSAVKNPSHTYTSAGSYTVSLTATNISGSDGETKTNYVTVTSGATDYFCSSISVTGGSLYSGSHTDAHSSNNVYMVVRSAKLTGNYYGTKVEYTFETGLGSLSSLTVTFESHPSAQPQTQKIYCWNYSTSAWDLKNTKTISSTSDQTTTVTVASPAAYRSGSGQVKVYVRMGDQLLTPQWYHYVDLIKITAAP